MNELASLMSDKLNEKFEKYMAETTSALRVSPKPSKSSRRTIAGMAILETTKTRRRRLVPTAKRKVCTKRTAVGNWIRMRRSAAQKDGNPRNPLKWQGGQCQ
jgi:hypothetical protein